MRYKKILITGGAGFIGSNFIRHVMQGAGIFKGTIVNLDKLTYSGNRANLRDLEDDRRYTFVKGDICDEKLVARLMKGCDLVINFAAESHVDRSIQDPSAFIRTNIVGTQVLLDAARKYKIKRFIQISTDEVYGSVARGYSDEESPLKPNSPYAASKAAADLLVRAYFATYKMPVIITRSSNNFGPYQYPEKVIPLFITNAIQDQKLPVYADGSNVRDWIFVGDNCSAVLFAALHGEAGGVYNIGGGTELKNIELTRMILKILKKPERLIAFVSDRPGHDKRYALDSYKLYKLGWRPAEGGFRHKLEMTVGWYKENQAWWHRLRLKKQKFW
ncbi:MAG: dTDP-glucose 4,6-dehydratase [Candidatus Omnitrophica bacterium]|nr:dTDP-glucose 4,6-dehydratase [Candidatus Omnitrophota bacterium]